MEKLLTQVTLDSATRRKDRAVTLKFTTSLEQSTEQFMEMDRLISDIGVLYFKSNGDLTEAEVKELDRVEVENEGKSKSQRLRSVLYIYYNQSNVNDMDFSEFYAKMMEKIISHYKSKLED